jgi:hypothetical protein
MRATRLADYLKSHGSLSESRKMANHTGTRTAQLYDRRSDAAPPDEYQKGGDLRLGFESRQCTYLKGMSTSVWLPGTAGDDSGCAVVKENEHRQASRHAPEPGTAFPGSLPRNAAPR